MRQRAAALIYSACVCATALGTLGAVGASGTRAALASGARATVSHGEAENESAARAEASRLLDGVSLPAGAVASPNEPAGDGSLLAQPASGPADNPYVVDDHAWWVVQGSLTQALAWFRSHPPDGAVASGSGSGAGVHVPPNGFLVFRSPGVTGVLAGSEVVLLAVQLASGSVGLRADVQVTWLRPRPASEMIPRGARILRLSVHGPIGGEQPPQRPLRITSSARIATIAALIDALPVAQWGVSACAADTGVRVRLAFYARAGAAPLAVARADPGGCGLVQMTILGITQPPLEGGPRLIEKIGRVLGRALQVRPRGHGAGRIRSST